LQETLQLQGFCHLGFSMKMLDIALKNPIKLTGTAFT